MRLSHWGLAALLAFSWQPALSQGLNIGEGVVTSGMGFNANAGLNSSQLGSNFNNAGMTGTTFGRRLRLPNVPDAVLNATFYTQDGLLVQHRILVDEQLGWVIGTHLDGVKIDFIQNLDTDPVSYLITAYDAAGNVVELKEGDIFVGNTAAGEYCPNLKKLPQSNIPFNVAMVIDASGSMRKALPDIHASVSAFSRQLPGHAKCQVATFTDELISHDIQSGNTASNRMFAPQPCALLQEATSVAQFVQTANGNTDIAGAMDVYYADSQQREGQSNFVALITDGLDGSTNRTFNRMMQTREAAVKTAGTYTFVNWLGDYDPRSNIVQLADSQLEGRIGSQRVGAEFFDDAIKQLNARWVVAPKHCVK